MTLLHSIFRAADKLWPVKVAYAHCDIPCGIYDPHTAQMAAHTIIRMIQLIEEAKSKMPAEPTLNDRAAFVHKIGRLTNVKEHHAEIAKNEIRILWGDYFKLEHLDKFPGLHDIVWKALKLASKVRQEINLEAAEELLEAVNRIAEIFWETKNVETHRRKALGYPTERETVYPKT